MITYPEIDPVAVSIGPVTVHWYGLMYLGGFAAGWLLARWRAKRPWSPITASQVDDLIFYGALGVVLGGRCGYVFFYKFDKFVADPLWLFRAWEGGMSFHGGLLGVIIACFIYGRFINRSGWDLLDFGAPVVPIGLGLGRLGNFIGQELWGKASDVPWAMVFPLDPESLPRHPTQLYEFALEGLLMFVLLWWFSRKQRPKYAVSGMFLLLYAAARFWVEFYRLPDEHLGYTWGWVTRGQELTLPMFIGSAVLFYLAYGRRSRAVAKG